MNKYVFASILGFIIGLIVAYFLHRSYVQDEANRIDTTTVVVVDTISYYYPVAKDSVVTRYVNCRLPLAEPPTGEELAVTDSMLTVSSCCFGGLPRQCDSATVSVPIEQKVYEDSTYKAWVSGYMVSLDSINTFNRTITTTITNRETKPPNRWGIGITAGYGYGKQGFTPFVGIGVTYSIFQW